jgi:hypothetical protein
MKPKNIELHIEELVLDGFDHVDRHRIAGAIERELTSLFAERGIPHSLSKGGEISRLDGGVFEMAADSRPETIGAKVAQSVYGGFKK